MGLAGMLIGYRLKRDVTWGNALAVDDYKDAAVQVVAAYDTDSSVREYEILQRNTITQPWKRIGGATRANGWAARGVG